jgi:Protein of unknown function (DUF2478)
MTVKDGKGEMRGPVKMIAVVQGAPNATLQEIFQTFVDRWGASARVAGVVAETHGFADRACSAGFLRNVHTGERYSIFQDFGPGSTTCHLDERGVLAATEAVRRDISAGCDLVVLSKFGKLEASGTGLLNAFNAAIDADIPVLTSVSPAREQTWAKFASPSFVVLAADPVKIDEWWRLVRSSTCAVKGNVGS